MSRACHLSFSSFPSFRCGSNIEPLSKEAAPRKRCEESCSKEEIENCSWKGKVKLKCKGRDIDPEFRENYCGQTRVKRGFPCCSCDLLENYHAKRHPPQNHQGDEKVKLSVWERYVVVVVDKGSLTGHVWCATLENARQEARDIRAVTQTPEEKDSILILKVLKL